MFQIFQIRILDLKYFFDNKPLTYALCKEKIRNRLVNGEIVELILEDQTPLKIAQTVDFDSYLKREVERISAFG